MMFESCGRPSRRMVTRTPWLRPLAKEIASVSSTGLPEGELVGLPQPGGHRAEQLAGHGRQRVEQTQEVPLFEDQQLHVGLGDDGRRPGAAVEERQLTEVL